MIEEHVIHVPAISGTSVQARTPHLKAPLMVEGYHREVAKEESMHTRLRIALVAVVVSSALLMVGSMLPWTVWDTKYDTVTVYGLKTSGASTLVIGLVVLAFVVPIARSSPRVGWPIGAMCLFLVALLVSAVHVARVPSPAPGDGAFSAGVGVWLCLAASVIGTIASLSVWHLMLEGGVSLATPSTA